MIGKCIDCIHYKQRDMVGVICGCCTMCICDKCETTNGVFDCGREEEERERSLFKLAEVQNDKL